MKKINIGRTHFYILEIDIWSQILDQIFSLSLPIPHIQKLMKTQTHKWTQSHTVTQIQIHTRANKHTHIYFCKLYLIKKKNKLSTLYMNLKDCLFVWSTKISFRIIKWARPESFIEVKHLKILILKYRDLLSKSGSKGRA